jgi:hypothetical protein
MSHGHACFGGKLDQGHAHPFTGGLEFLSYSNRFLFHTRNFVHCNLHDPLPHICVQLAG